LKQNVSQNLLHFLSKRQKFPLAKKKRDDDQEEEEEEEEDKEETPTTLRGGI
jgi:CO dehydrogenase/acetyl-CoA synthase beta subunit